MDNFKHMFVFDFKQVELLDNMMRAAYAGLLSELSSIFDEGTYKLVWKDIEYRNSYYSFLCLELQDDEQLAIVKLRYNNLRYIPHHYD
jgi:hypothetical protein